MNRIIFSSLLLIFSISVCANLDVQLNSDYSSREEMAEHIKQMASRCWSLREKNLDSAILIGKEALDLALKYNVEQEVPRICNFLGVLYLHYMPDNKTAIPYFHQALEIGSQLNDSVQMAYAYNNLGDSFMFTGNLALALQYAEASVQIFEKLQHTSGIAYGYINLAVVYKEEGNYEKSLNYFYKVKEMREAVEDRNGLASVLREIAIVYQRIGELDKSEEFFEMSYQYHMDIKNLRYASFCLSGMAENYYLKNELDEAYDHYIRAIELNDDRKYLYGQIDNYVGLALVYAKQNKRVEGENVLFKALQISNLIGMPSNVLKVYKAYGSFYKILNDYEKATQSLERFLVISDSILSTQQFDILNEIQTNFLVNQSLEETKQQLKYKNIEEKYLFIIISLMLIVSIGFIWRMHSQRKMNRKLKQINKSKDKLFSVISHDLKTPFNSLLGFSEILIEKLENKNYKNATKYATIINRSAEENLKLLTNLLNWSRSQTGRIKFNPQPIFIDLLFKELNDLFEDHAKNYELQLDFSSTVKEEISADLDILKIVLSNLISNALKYTKEKGMVQIKAWDTSSNIFLSVTDNGLGMTNEMLANLFDNTQSQTTLGIRQEKGSGLGLILCSELIKIHKGLISAKSALGKGSVFEIEIPKP